MLALVVTYIRKGLKWLKRKIRNGLEKDLKWFKSWRSLGQCKEDVRRGNKRVIHTLFNYMTILQSDGMKGMS